MRERTIASHFVRAALRGAERRGLDCAPLLRIAGIEPGRQIRVEGRLGVRESQRIMFNPRYELR